MSKIEDEVCRKIQARADVGLSKYGYGVMRDKISELEHGVEYWKGAFDAMNDFAIQLQKKIDEHNKLCIDTCGDKTRCGYAAYERRCPDCARDWMIDP